MTTMLLPTLLFGCRPGLSDELIGELHHQWGYAQSTGKGTAKVTVDVLDGFTALQFVADVPAPYQVHVRTVEAPGRVPVFSSAEWNDNPRSKTNAGFVSSVATLDWPILLEDPPLVPGRWKFELGVVDENQAYVAQQFGVDVLVKPDPDFTDGQLIVNVIYTEDLQDNADLRTAIGEAEDHWRALYASIGIEVGFLEYAYDVEDLLPPAFGEEDRYEDVASQTTVRAVNLVLSKRIDGLDQIFGIAGDIPGPLVPTRRSAVQVATLLAAGPDGEFSPEETRLLAETMAHETLHFLGLFHPVESTWAAWDVLGDTDECDDEGGCVSSLGQNLMFPFPVCSVASCEPQSEVTDAQAAVAHRAVAVQ